MKLADSRSQNAGNVWMNKNDENMTQSTRANTSTTRPQIQLNSKILILYLFTLYVWNLLDRFDCSGESSPSTASPSFGLQRPSSANRESTAFASELTRTIPTKIFIVSQIDCIKI